jgi:hypothetical protein
LLRIKQEKFDNIILQLLNDCGDIINCNCDYCAQSCILYQKLKEQQIDETPDIMNTVRGMFVTEYEMRDKAIRSAPRFSEISKQEYNKVISNTKHFQLDANDDLVAIY